VTTLRHLVLRPLLSADADEKALLTQALTASASNDASVDVAEPDGIPGRPERPVLVPHTKAKQRSVNTVEGRAALIHAIAHIELNAIDLALDAVWRFAGMPDEFYRQWVGVAREEAYHFTLLRDHLRAMGYEYGDFPAHNALWEMAEKTKGDVLARVALVPRTLETRGLDASPPLRAKLVNAGDHRAGEILDIILRDEIGHVALGNRWYRWLCEQRGLDPVATYTELAEKYGAPKPRGPFNLEARRAAGFTEEELRALSR
jgi:uncharacterized ferritin-like protein (DUF455 family)